MQGNAVKAKQVYLDPQSRPDKNRSSRDAISEMGCGLHTFRSEMK